MKQKQLKLFETEDILNFRRKQTLQYDEFTAKFNLSHKKTTDDCYTPPEVYNCVRDYFLEQFPDWKDRPIVRPFCPDGDFERFDYPDSCVVIDNPPFSISAKIVRWYIDHNIQFALFAPHQNGRRLRTGQTDKGSAGQDTRTQVRVVPQQEYHNTCAGWQVLRLWRTQHSQGRMRIHRQRG